MVTRHGILHALVPFWAGSEASVDQTEVRGNTADAPRMHWAPFGPAQRLVERARREIADKTLHI